MYKNDGIRLVTNILMSAQKAKSNATESLVGSGSLLSHMDRFTLMTIEPYLFTENDSYDDFGIVQVASRLQSKGHNLEIGELRNLIWMVRKSASTQVALGVIGVNLPDTTRMKSRWDDQDV